MNSIQPNMRSKFSRKNDEDRPSDENHDCQLKTIVDILRYRARSTPDQTAYIYLRDGESDEQSITYAKLDRNVRRIAAMLQERGCRKKQVLLMYPQGIALIEAFFGCLYAGAVAVPMYPPSSARLAQRMDRILTNGAINCIMTDVSCASKLNRLAAGSTLTRSMSNDIHVLQLGAVRLPCLVTDIYDEIQCKPFENEPVAPGDLAFLQYTSGSTGTPKGVMITHANIMSNERAIQEIFGSSEKSFGVSWLPILHDMGLIGSTLQPLFVGFPLAFMSPLHFMQRPVRWLRAISKYQATISGGPNFAYDYCVSKVKEKDKQSLDLSHWSVAYNGSEPVRGDTLRRFQRAFAKCGLRSDAQFGVYGMAESTLILTGTPRKESPPVDEETGYISSGRVASEHEIKIVDPKTCVCLPDGQKGEIWAAGGSIAKGYYAAPKATAETFNAKIKGRRESFLRTGDMGYLQNGHLFVTGRIKDILIIRGRNYHAEDIEWSLRHMDGLRENTCAAFLKDQDDPDSLTILAGVNRVFREDWSDVTNDIRARVYEDFQLQVNRVVLIKPKSLPRTTSGKIKRSLARRMYLSGQLHIVLDQAATETERGASKTEVVGADSTHESPLMTSEAKGIVAIWAEVLGLEKKDIGLRDNFFTLGGHSVQLLELADRLNVSVELLFRYPTIESFLSRSGDYQFPDVAKDIWLPPATAQERVPSGTSLVTGGNGLFGFHLLVSMIERSDDHYICLIRGENDAQVHQKFRQTVEYFGFENRIDMKRITLLRGDFGQERLGLDVKDYTRLAETVQCIYHIGSHVNNWLPYEGIRGVNVEGTRRLLELARTGRKKKFHYASTSTFCPDKQDKSIFLETDDICPADINKYNGYDISKYVSEQLCALARRDGYDCNIYRLVWVGGHHETGLSKINDGFNIMLRILLTLGVYPKGNYLHDVIPVDLMAEAVASVQSKASNTTFNITSQSNESVDLTKIVAMLRNMGYKLSEVSRKAFVDRIKNYPDEKWDKYCRSYRQLIIRLFEEGVKPESFYDSTNLKRCLDDDVRERLQCKFVDDWFQKAVLFLVRNGALPTPGARTYEDDLARIAEWNQTAVCLPKHQCVHQVFETQAAKRPNGTAIVFGRRRMTYSELDRRANQFASYLAERRIGPGDFVGICLQRSFDLYASLLGVMKTGAAYVPLCPSYPEKILRHIIQDSGTDIVLTTTETKSIAAAARCCCVCIDEPEVARSLNAYGADGQIFKPRADPDPGALVYVIYTSGTTGKPKGVMIEHRGVVNHSFSMIERFGLTQQDNVLQFATMNFDSFVEEVFPAFSSGAAITIIRDNDRSDIDKLRSVIKHGEVTFLKFPTAFWHRVSEESFEGLGVRAVGIGGEEADILKFSKWLEVNPTIPVINTYGPTETTVTATVAFLDAQHAKARRLPIGTPIDNTRIHILDKQKYPVPIGTVGDLYISGIGVGRGYLNQAELTRRVFVQSDAVMNGDMIYYTGDHARWTERGEIEYFGRSDNQVKIRGYRVELGAIESLLNEHAMVTCASVVLQTVQGEKRVVAFVQSPVGIEALGLRDYLRKRLPVYMIPEAIVQIENIPVFPSGKIDRCQLERLEPASQWMTAHLSPPETDLQSRIAAIWSRLLGIEKIGIDDDFLSIGGHSLLAITLLQRLYQELEIKVSLEDFYENLTIRALAALVEKPTRPGRNLTSIVAFPKLSDIKDGITMGRMFLVHGVGGNLATFYPLVRQVQQILSEEYNFKGELHGLQANAVPGRWLGSCKEMIDAYVAHILSVQPHGPYLLCGWSYGASVAFLIAQELVRGGHRVAGFVSIDAQAPQPHPDIKVFFKDFNIQNAADLYDDELLDIAMHRFGRKFGFEGRGGTGLKDKLHLFLGYPDTCDTRERDTHNMVAVANLYNAGGFDPKTLPVDSALLIRASQSRFEDYEQNWSTAIDASRIIHQHVEGDHWSIMGERSTAALLAEFFSGVYCENALEA